MIPRIDTRMYTNLMLTVIAVVLVALAAQQLGINVIGNAQAQRKDVTADLNRTATGVAIDTTIPQTQDVAVAQATSEVAAANREIAQAILQLASAVKDGTSDIKTAIGRTGSAAPAAATTAAPAAATAATPDSDTRPLIQVR